MASTFPTSLDTFTNPTASSLLTSPSHSLSHSDLNDAVEALEAKVAIGNTVLGSYISYTPSFTAGVTIGNGVGTGAYCRVNDFVHVYGIFTLGSTSAVTAAIDLDVPVQINAGMRSTTMMYGFVNYLDASTSDRVDGATLFNGTATSIALRAQLSSGTYVSSVATSGTVPFTWATSDKILWNLYYRAA
jgi:hypothetical protein